MVLSCFSSNKFTILSNFDAFCERLISFDRHNRNVRVTFVI